MKCLAVIGSANCAQDDYKKFLEYKIKHDVLVVGIDALNKYKGQVKYFATYHAEDIPKCQDRAYKIICHKQWNDMVDIIRPIDLKKEPSGSSALLGTLVAIDRGYKKIILCGCPLQGKNDKGVSYVVFQKGWKFHKQSVADYVRSMSGWTKEFFGYPTLEWLR